VVSLLALRKASEFDSRLYHSLLPTTDTIAGAGSADFRRFIQKFYESQDTAASTPAKHPTLSFGQDFYAKIWDWLRNHPDVRIVYRKEARDLALLDFEALERQETGGNGVGPGRKQHTATTAKQSNTAANLHQSRLSANTSLRERLRQRLSEEGYVAGPEAASQHISSTENETPSADRVVNATSDTSTVKTGAASLNSSVPARREEQQIPNDNAVQGTDIPRRMPKAIKGLKAKKPVFDEPPGSNMTPRIHVSQNRAWQAVAGHAIDLKKLPAYEFVLLSIIAAHGATGILQPELVKVSGQDKRSVPHRTDELARKGYIEKRPVAKKVRTSLCLHKKFVMEAQRTDTANDAFQNRVMMLSNFVELLYSVLKESENGLVGTRDLRKKMVSTFLIPRGCDAKIFRVLPCNTGTGAQLEVRSSDWKTQVSFRRSVFGKKGLGRIQSQYFNFFGRPTMMTSRA
jgi:hypothetical protein